MSVHSSPADLEIKPRPLFIDREADTPRWWLGGDPVGTAVLNALSLTFPDGERFFIRSIKAFAKDLPPRLAVEVRAFVQQEGAHTREHIAFNELTKRSGYETADIQAYVDGRLEAARARPAIGQLAATMALEHFTAAFAHRILADRDFLAGAPAELARLWRWHSIEEIEHKGVAYDVFMHATRHLSPWRRWTIRRVAMFMTTLLFTQTVRSTTRMLLKQDGITGWRAELGLFRFLWLKPGLYRRMLGDYFAFYRPAFHPWQVDDRALIRGAETELGLSPA